MFALTDLSVWLFARSPNRDILSGVCNISHRPLTRHWNNNFKCMAFAAKQVQAAAAVLEHLGGWRELTTPFMSWKSRVNRMAPVKHLDGLAQRVWTSVSTSAQLPPSLLLLKIPLWLFCRLDPGNQWNFKTPAATLWTGLVSMRCQGAAFSPRRKRLEMLKSCACFPSHFVHKCL